MTLSAAMDQTGRVLLDECGEPLFPWWSFTKTAIAVLVMQAWERQQCDLDAPFREHPFSLRQLMQHRAGLRDYGALPGYGDAVAQGADPWSVEQLLAEADFRNLAYPPGTNWVYSNVGYLLLRQFLEEVHNASLAEIMQARICQPLGLTARVARTRDDFEQLYWNAHGYHPDWVYHGCLMGTATDALRLLRAVLNGDLLSAASKDQLLSRSMQGPAIPGRVWSETGYGLGLMIGAAQPVGRVIGHTGCGPFSANLIAQFPDTPSGLLVASFCPMGDETPAEFEAVKLATKLNELRA
ncbi:serine hydrolase [Ruegeria sp. HKCCD4884]|uniref:serine hydrolase domain-containing protein n=1 Tax=Ruegeria sp. HKCCD4884 TaxID=2683022 RepID=UPI001490E8C5|nr:serine hydrolase domain-containing protein [Ruegeria sp. HKCCD4884]NOD94304.1 serine hydrolase [Ruegeria sp. HKCCD4884]